MKPSMRDAERELRSLVEAYPVTHGMTVRARGSHLVLARPLPPSPFGDEEPDDRVRFTHLGGARYGLSIRRHTGKWEKAPFDGSLKDLVEVVSTAMQHVVAEFP